ncbi:hypothetical protein EVB78_104 [Rhizobium phage RHph_N1_15]|nr:hypothetical protein EVB77_104 [Rhizobium phage RHph_N1_10]QIG69306.1 hypothetical protein EVB78_104 [Rhizobium phage RHph_N1_15]QIG75166.1 hypothetical protein EVC15_104 [Rhizobium phage RHph_N2_6]
MSYRLHRAIGWGMAWDQFEETVILDCEAQDTSETVDAIFGKATDADLTIPMEERSVYFKTRGVSTPIDNRLLALDFVFDETGGEDAEGYRLRIGPKLGRATDLFQLVMDPDKVNVVLFFPNASYAEKWNRRWDDLDYAFEAYRNGPPGDAECRDFWHVAKFGWYPFANYLMDRDGQPLEWEMFSRLDRTYPDGWFPAVPTEIRWYLKKLGIMDDAGVNKLRPIVAQWWC